MADEAGGSPFWRFSLKFYRQPGVADACIALQDGCGVDVNLLLFLLWQASEQRRLPPAEVRSIAARVADWNREVIVPLRDLRRRLKGKAALVEASTAELFRTKVKGLELEAERLQQEAMFAFTARGPLGEPAPSLEEAARANLAALARVMDCAIPAAQRDVLLRALAPN
jgi:uncharacterized protein (TIGR02444 family)